MERHIGLEPMPSAWKADILTSILVTHLYGLHYKTRTCDPQFRKLTLYPTELSREMVARVGVEPTQSVTTDLQSATLSNELSRHKGDGERKRS